MVYSRYIYSCGPYLYKSVREGTHVRSIYLGKGGVGSSVNSGYGDSQYDKTREDLNTSSTSNKTEEDKMKIGEEKVIEDKIIFPAREIGAGQQIETHKETTIKRTVSVGENIKAKYGESPYFVQFQSYDVIIDRQGRKRRRPSESVTGARFFRTYEEAYEYAKS